jgi:glutaredoxin 2
MSLSHLGPGSVNPPLQKGLLRLYSMVFCPYAQRVRLVLAAKQILYETVNIKLKVKPEWYKDINPAQTVPCLQFDDGRTLGESLIVSEYLDDAFPDKNRLKPSDAYENARQKLAIEWFSKAIPFYYRIGRNENTEEVFTQFKTHLKNFLTEYLNERNFLGGIDFYFRMKNKFCQVNNVNFFNLIKKVTQRASLIIWYGHGSKDSNSYKKNVA